MPLFGIVSRLASQKGFDLLTDTLPKLLQNHDVRLAVVGTGDARYEKFFAGLAEKYRGRAWFFGGYDDALAHWIEGASDVFLMPSQYEPCGLNQMYRLRYGTDSRSCAGPAASPIRSRISIRRRATARASCSTISTPAP